MTYPIIRHLYETIAQKLLTEIGTREFCYVNIAFQYGNKLCRFVATLFIHRHPSGGVSDAVPVWWEFHTGGVDGECPNDFSFNELKPYLLS